MCICIDGEIFYDTSIEFEIKPYAVDFVCPEGIDLGKLRRAMDAPGPDVHAL
jgi:hypothetical protein